MAWGPMTIGEMLDQVSEQYPNKKAIISEDRQLSYGELKDHVEGAARAFLARGIQKGDKVSVWL